jgi:class 3 adenylate cyclase
MEGTPTIEERMDDIRAVMDAAGSERAAILGLSEGGPIGTVFAATYPDRTSALVLWNTFATLMQKEPDHPWGWAGEEIVEPFIEMLEKNWGKGFFAPYFVASKAEDQAFQEWWSRFERLSQSPGMAANAYRMNLNIDIRHLLAAVHVPTLVLHPRSDPSVSFNTGKYLADNIEGAEFVELEGSDHFGWHDPNVANELERFLTGKRQPLDVDRVLTTVLFIDIVGSTERLAESGDRQWREMLEEYYAIVKRNLGRFRGRFIEATGDGVLSTFDGPGRAIRCACATADEIQRFDLDVRSGLHTGEVEVREQAIAGMAVHIGARVCGLAGAGEVLVSRTVKDLVVGSGLKFDDRGDHRLKGVPDEWRLFCVQR